MLQEPQVIRHYQHLSDAMVGYWHRGYNFTELGLYLNGYLAGLRSAHSLEAYQLNRLE